MNVNMTTLRCLVDIGLAILSLSKNPILLGKITYMPNIKPLEKAIEFHRKKEDERA